MVCGCVGFSALTWMREKVRAALEGGGWPRPWLLGLTSSGAGIEQRGLQVTEEKAADDGVGRVRGCGCLVAVDEVVIMGGGCCSRWMRREDIYLVKLKIR